MYWFDWPTATVVTATIVALTIAYIVRQLVISDLYKQLTELRDKVHAMETRNQGYDYQVREMWKNHDKTSCR